MSADVAAVLDLVKRYRFHVFPVDSPALERCAGIGQGHYAATCHERGKHPCVPWKARASADPQDVAVMFTGHPRNVGIACGPSGLVVIDEDTPGDLERYAASVGGSIPDTFTVTTGRGSHYYFAANGVTYGNTVHLEGYGVDVRGQGGYVVGPGSLHASGVEYRVALDVPPAPVPPWLAQALAPARQGDSGLAGEPFTTVEAVQPRGLAAVPQVIANGTRHNELVRYACSLRARNVPMAEAEVLFEAVWQRCEQPPNDRLDWSTARATLEDCYARYRVAAEYADQPADADQPAGGDGLLGRVLRRSDLAHLPKPTPLVKGLLDYPAAAVLIGEYGLGKTFLALHLACCVATGRPWLGNDVERRKVLLVVGEGGSGLDKRIAAWEQGYNRGHLVADDDLIVVVQPKSLASPEVWRRIAEQCAVEGVGFVILDTLSSLAPDADETKDAATVLAQMHRLAAGIGGTVLLVHHPGWNDKERSRGGSQIEANADFVLVLTGDRDHPLVTLRRKKVKDGQDGQLFWMRREPFKLHGDHVGETSVLLRSVDPGEVGVPMVERIRTVLDGCADAGATGKQILDEVGDVPRSTFYKALTKAQHDGVVEARGEGVRQRYYLAGKAG